MAFDLIWVDGVNNLVSLGQCLALSGLGYGAWLRFRDAWKFGNPLDWKSADFPIPMFPVHGETRRGKSAASLPLLPKDLHLIEGLRRYGPDEYSLSGNGVMDTQHHRLSDYTNDLRTAILSGGSVEEVNAIIDALIRDLVQHFQNEEAILLAASYAGTAKHAAVHRTLINSAALLVGQFRAGALGVGELFQFLADDVIAKHMLGADRAIHSVLGRPALSSPEQAKIR